MAYRLNHCRSLSKQTRQEKSVRCMVDSVIHFNWTKTKGIKSAAQLISTPKGAHGAQNWWVICSRRISYNPLQSQTSCAINHITTADVRPREHHLQFCLMFFTVETKRGKKKEKRKTCDKLQRVRKPCGMRSSQTPIMMHMSILLNYLGWQNLETQRQIQRAVMV